MSKENEKAKIVISKCLEFAACRYDGKMIENPIVRKLKSAVDFIPVCPEMELGLGCPRDTIRIEAHGKKELIQPKTKRNLSREMDAFSDQFANGLDKVDGFILKSKSPSCGIQSVSLFKDGEESEEKISGFFAQRMLELYPEKVFYDETQLDEASLRKFPQEETENKEE